MNEIVQQQDSDDDGFSGSVTTGKLIKGQILKWTEAGGWSDRDGMVPPEHLLVLGCTEALQCWKDKRVIDTITVKPLPDIDALNAAVPKHEWGKDFNNNPKPPWEHVYVVYLIDPDSAGFYTYLNSTIGARIAWENLRERVITMRALRGEKVLPRVKLSKRPMKTAFGPKHRPDFEIESWRNLGGGGEPALPDPSEPKQKLIQAPGQAAPAQTRTGPEKPSAADTTLSKLQKVDVPSVAEEMDDAVLW